MTFDLRFPKPETGVKTGEHKQFAQSGINYLLADNAELIRFMRAAGYDPDGLRSAIGSTELTVAVMDYFAANEAALLAMCANMNLDVKEFMSSWRRLNSSA